MTFTPRFAEALVGAAEIHRTQTRKGTAIPYVEHVLGVASIALFHGANEDEAIAALLHDAIEDAPVDRGPTAVRKWILASFGPTVLEIVEGCTDTDEVPKPSWRKRKEKYIAHVANASRSVVLVSAADKLHNATEILADYRQLGDELWARFNADAGRDGTIGYYRGLVTAFRSTGHHSRMVRELDEVVKQIESAAGQGRWPLA